MTNQPAADILKPGHNCWKQTSAQRFSLLIDGANYFAALRATMLQAEQSIFIVGWDVDSRIRLVGNTPPTDDAPHTLRDFLIHLLRQRRDLRIRVLLWDYSVLYALEREPLPALNLAWTTPPGLDICLDDRAPMGACHHQKMIVVDGKVAFCGGMDLSLGRWDTRDHAAENTDRADPDGTPRQPFHDVQCMVDGQAAQALGALVTERWLAVTGETVPIPDGASDPWPTSFSADVTDCHIGVARTVAPLNEGAGVHEIEALYLDMIGSAERCLYLENQYATSDVISRALVKALAEKPDLEVILVSSKDQDGFLEHQSMVAGRARFMARFREANVDDRIRLVYPQVPDENGDGVAVYVHAKVMIVDDRLLRIGSANLNNRSMGTDGECDLILVAQNEEHRKQITCHRHDLMAEHLGLNAKTIAAEIDRCGSLCALIDARQKDQRTLRQMDCDDAANGQLVDILRDVTDPERPADSAQFVGDMLSARVAKTPIRRRTLVMAAVTLIALIFAVIQYV